jgi:hypothetical protein
VADLLPYFFLSYARSDDDIYVRRFYGDLCKEVRLRSGSPANAEIGFLDTRDIDLGAPWSDELTTALQRSGTFVSLCSPIYFNSEYCGREWTVFAERVRRCTTRSGSRPPVMFPLMWMADTPMHPIVQELQQTTDRLGSRYREDGLRDYMRLGKHRDRRRTFVSALAEMIVRNVRRYALPALDGVDLQSVASAWTTATTPVEQRDDRSRSHGRLLDERCDVLLDGVRIEAGPPSSRVLGYAVNRLLAEGEVGRSLPDLGVARPILDGPGARNPESSA